MSTEWKQLAYRLQTHVETLAATPREPQTSAHAKGHDYILDHLLQSGFGMTATRQLLAEMVDCANLYSTPVPADDRLPLVIVGAHYDSVPGSPGADDNASAVAALLELARWLQPRLQDSKNWKARLQLVAYDLEEYGLLGSFTHARQIKSEGWPVRGMISLEMLGYTDSRPGSQQLPPMLRPLYPDVANFIGVVGNESSGQLLQEVVLAMKGVPGLRVEYLAVPGNGEMLRETRLSDHSPFWDLGFPALMITDTSFFRNPHYHKSTDTPDTLDYPFMARVTQGVCEAVWRLLQ